MRQKTREIITATNLDQPLQQVDSIAAKSFDEMEKRTRKVKFYTYLLVNPKSPRMAWIFSDCIRLLLSQCLVCTPLLGLLNPGLWNKLLFR